MKVFFDATVWCGALLNPFGPNGKLLDLASTGGPLKGVTSDVVLLETYRHAVQGDLGHVFDPDDVWAYVDAHRPLLDISQAPIGRALPKRTDLHNLAIGAIVYELTGRSREDMLKDLAQQATLPNFDAHDLHVVAASYAAGAEVLCSSDRGFFKQSLGALIPHRPTDLAHEYGLI